MSKAPKKVAMRITRKSTGEVKKEYKIAATTAAATAAATAATTPTDWISCSTEGTYTYGGAISIGSPYIPGTAGAIGTSGMAIFRPPSPLPTHSLLNFSEEELDKIANRMDKLVRDTKVDLYKNILDKFDNCEDMIDIQNVVSEMTKEFKRLKGEI